MTKHPLKDIVTLQKQGEAVGIYSCCSANEYVIEAALERAKATNTYCLIESTSNQVDQFGGYTNMTPKDFHHFVEKIADKVGISMKQVILGGDHLGPLTWTSLPEEKAMENAKELIRSYVAAGFTKIHIDTSMKVADDDPNVRLSDETIARRGSILAKVAQDAYHELLKTNPEALQPVYIVGSEVPIPGGATGATVDQGIQVTKVEDFKQTVKTFENAFKNLGLEEAWDNVIGVVVQPGVEEKDAGCTEYDRAKAVELMASIKEYPSMVFEGHSTDYQTKYKLKELVEDGVGILKVGPALTFALREGIFALAYIENEAFKNTDVKVSNFIDVLEDAMLAKPDKWAKYYTGDENALRIKRKFSFSDRCRYYLPNEKVQEALKTLITNLRSLDEVPLNLMSQFMPIQYTKVREGSLKNDPEELIKDRVKNCIDEYLFATHQEKIAIK